MTNITKIMDEYVKKEKAFKKENNDLDKKIEQIKTTSESQIKQLEKKSEKLYESRPHWTDAILRPIVDEIAKRLNCEPDHSLTPMGLNAEVSVFFKVKSGTLGLHFIPKDLDNGIIAIRNHAINTKRYRYGTIGEMNGDNSVVEKMPMTINGLIKAMKRHDKLYRLAHNESVKNNLYSFETSSKILNETEKYRLSEVVTEFDHEKIMKRMELKINGKYILIARYETESWKDRTKNIIKAIESDIGYYCEYGKNDIEKELEDELQNPSLSNLAYSHDVYDFSGNHKAYSGAFSYSIWDKSIIKKIRKSIHKKSETNKTIKEVIAN